MSSWLIDKSALVRLNASPDAAEWAARVERGLVRIATITRLEIGYSARSGPEFRAGLRQPLIIGATAELAGLTVLHLDKDFEIIAAVTGQPVERLST